MKLLLCCALLAPCYLAINVNAQRHEESLTNWDPSGNDLVASCSAGSGSSEEIACMAFIHGVIGGFDMGSTAERISESKGHPTVDLCVPNGVTNGQIIKVIRTFADRHPEQLHYPADVVVTRAITDAWPLERTTEQGHVCANVALKAMPNKTE